MIYIPGRFTKDLSWNLSKFSGTFFPPSVLANPLFKRTAAVSFYTAHLSLRYMGFASASLSGYFSSITLSLLYLLLPLCSSVVSSATTGVKLLWLKFPKETEKIDSQPCRKHHLLSLFFFFLFSTVSKKTTKNNVFGKCRHFRKSISVRYI